ncbi:hypothetical protein E3J79_01365, partial [Candidatus Dependentiae bacterium]
MKGYSMKHINQIILLFSLFITCLSHAVWTPLHQAVKDSNLEQVQKLFAAGVDDVNVADDYGYTPLHLAVIKGHEPIIELLLEKGANVNVVNQFCYTPLHLAVIKGNHTIVTLLFVKGKGAKVNVVDWFSDTPLHCATKKNHKVITAFLLDVGANINAVNKNGWTQLHGAVMNDHK